MTPEQMTKMREIFRKVSNGKNPGEMNEKERADFQKKLQDELKKAGITMPAGMAGMMGGGGRRAGAPGASGASGAPGASGEAGGGGRPGGGGRRGGRGGDMAGMGMGSSSQFSQKELDNAKLPPAPEDDAQLDVLLRPGMLADVEIIVEKIPNAIHVPTQAIFERDNKPFVYMRSAKGTWEERPVVIARRTESTVVLSSGVKTGDTVAMADPMAKPGDKKSKSESKGGGAMGALPAGGAK